MEKVTQTLSQEGAENAHPISRRAISETQGGSFASPPPFQLKSGEGPIQRKLQLTGEAEHIQSALDLINRNLFGYTATLGEDGDITLEPNGLVGPPTQRQQAMYGYLRTIIDDPATTSVAVDSNRRDVIAGSYNLSTIDMQDILAYGDDGGKSDIGTMAHELVEQYYKQVHGTDYGGEGHGAHHEGIDAENAVNGYIRGPQRTISGSRNADGTINAVVELDFTHPDGRVVTSRLTIQENNVISNENRDTR